LRRRRRRRSINRSSKMRMNKSYLKIEERFY
jgi:hypothetical protein